MFGRDAKLIINFIYCVYKLNNFKVKFKVILKRAGNIWHGKRKRVREREEERKCNRVTTRPCIETNYACGSNLRRRKYTSNAFKVNCISLCRARIVCSSPRHVTMHNMRKSAHHTHMYNYKKKKERKRTRAKKLTRGREGKRRGSLRAHENCMENKLHGQREHSCERITRAMTLAQYASVLHT